MSTVPDTTPVIVGAGHTTNRFPDVDAAVEPAQLCAGALGEAAGDAGLTTGRLAETDSLDVLNIVSWSYADPCGEVARRAGITPARQGYSPVGGEQPTVVIDAAACRIADGNSELAVITGGEAMRSRMLCGKAGQQPPWRPEGTSPAPLDATRGIRGIGEYGLTEPASVYPLFENAYRAAWRQGPTANQRRSAGIWAAFSDVAARTPGAWFTEPRSAEEIATPGRRNRMVAYPYPKLMCAHMEVDQAAAVILASAGRARRLGIPADQWVYPWGGAAAQDTDEVVERPTYADAPALRRILDATLALRGLSAGDVELFELYSCFPIVPKLAANALELGDDRPWTAAGGLTFYGGPLSAYMCCATVHMTRALRRGDGRTGLLYGNGEYLTKHHGLLLSTEPAAGRYPRGPGQDLQAEIDALPVPDVVEQAEGPARIETYTVRYDREGASERGVVIGRLDDGRRFVAGTPDDPDTLGALTDSRAEAVGRRGRVVRTDGGNRFELD